MSYKDKEKNSAYMKKYYKDNPEQREKHKLLCKKYRLNHAKNTIQPSDN